MRSLDLVILGTSLFGVNQGYPGRFISSRTAWTLGIFNLCYSLIVTYLIFSEEYFKVDGDLSNNYIARKVYFYFAILTVVTLQIRYLSRRHRMAPFGRELYRLYQLSTWSGDIYGSIARIVIYIGWYMLYQCLPAYAEEFQGRMGWRILEIFFYWSNFVPTAATEYIGQAMLLLEHEFKVLHKITEAMVTGRDYGMKKLRNLNRRHASLFALYDRLARLTGTDSLLIIESERFLILTNLFIQVNFNLQISLYWNEKLLDSGVFGYRIERVTHYCFQGHRIIVEANRFAPTLNEIDPLDLENDEFFIELQIIRKQAKLRKVQYDCNRFLKLDMKLIFQISKDLLTLIIVLMQVTTDPRIGTSKPANVTVTDNVTEYYLHFSNVH